MFAIGEVSRRVGMRASAVRYYEERGLIEPYARRGGKRLYDEKAIERLLMIRVAKELGFSLDEIRVLLNSFAEARWTRLASTKLAALDDLSQRIETMREGLRRIATCKCVDVDACAHTIAVFRTASAEPPR
jgi:MerR family redox-sensitive transcriptional activator SoxR